MGLDYILAKIFLIHNFFCLLWLFSDNLLLVSGKRF